MAAMEYGRSAGTWSRAHQALAPSPCSQLAKPSMEAGAARTSSGARRVRSFHRAMWEVRFSRLMSSQSASRVLIVSRATSIRAPSTSESRLPSA